MARSARTRQAILDYLAARPKEVAFLRTEFVAPAIDATRSGVDKALRNLVADGVLVRGGWGVLVRAEYNPILKAPAPINDFMVEVLRKLGVTTKADPAIKRYTQGVTDQVPVGGFYQVGTSRISRKIGFGRSWVCYERQ